MPGYPLVGGMRQSRFAGTNFKSRKLLENAPAKRPIIMTPAFFAGDRVHYPGALPGRIVRRLFNSESS